MSHVKVPCLALGVILALSCCVFGAKDNRSYVAGKYLLTLDGVNCGFLKSVEGGDVTAEVINEAVGPDSIVHKHIGKPKYEEFEMEVNLGMNKPLYEWIRQSWTQNYRRVNGSITAMDLNMQAKSEQQFFNALLTETTIPTLDGGSKEPAHITVKFSPEYTRPGKGDGKADLGAPKTAQKQFLPSNFKLEIDGLDCTKVNKVDSFTVKRTAVTNDIGKARDYAKEPGKLEFPNLKITFSERSADSWRAWHENFVIKGNNDQKNEKSGSLTFLSANLKEELVTIRFYNMGIFRLRSDQGEANADAIKRVVAELYVEKMDFECKAGAVGADTTVTPPVESVQTPTPAVPRTLRRAG